MECRWKVQDGENGQKNGQKDGQPCRIQICTMEEFRREFPDVFRRILAGSRDGRIRFCRAESLNGAVSGTFVIPSKKDPSGNRTVFGFCLEDDSVTFADDQDFVEPVLNEMHISHLTDPASPSRCLFDFMEYLIKDDVQFLQEFEERLTGLEEQLLSGCGKDFDREILRVRKELSVLGAYYQQLSDVGETLSQNAAEREDEKDTTLFGLYSGKADRLQGTVQMLKEYSLQLREMHQTQIDVRQNEIMQLLTVVTTVFMPLTLIAGWYGMNFVNMPELKSPYGYFIICGICAVIIAIEIWFFRKKKWFQ